MDNMAPHACSLITRRRGRHCLPYLCRKQALTAEVAAAMAAAAKGAGSKAAAAAAANEAYEAALDQVLALGWAHTDSASFDAFAEELQSAPSSCAGALQVCTSAPAAGLSDIWHLVSVVMLQQ